MEVKYKVAMFDFDGTVMDSGPGIIRCAKETVAEFGYPMPKEEIFRKFIGPPLMWSFKNAMNVSPKEATEMVEVYRRRYHASKGMYEGYIYEGIESLLCDLNDKNVVCSIASAKREVTVVNTLKHFSLTKYFSVVCGTPPEMEIADKVAVMKTCLAKLSVDPKEVLMIGDTSFDAQASEELGIDFCAVMWGYGFDKVEDLAGHKYKYIAHNMPMLHEFLLGKS